MGEGEASRQRAAEATRVAAVAIVGVSLWLLTRPFNFAFNDPWLYAFMAMAWVDPVRYGGDLFLRYGSQDTYSIFSPFYGWFVHHLGLADATRLLTLAGGGLWLLGSWRLVHALLDERRAKMAFLLLAALPMPYAGFSALVVGEGFVTGRIYAEALSLLALAEMARARWLTSVAGVAVAAAVHPIMAAPAFGVGFIVEALRRRWLFFVAGLGVAVALALTVAGVPPLDRLLVVMDPLWLAAVRLRGGFLFVSAWAASDWLKLVSETSAVLAAALFGLRPARSWFAGVLIVGAAGVIASVIGGDLLHSVLILQLQLWRCLWLLAWAAFPALLSIVPQGRSAKDWLPTLGLGFGLVSGFSETGAVFSVVGLALSFPQVRASLTPRVARTLLVVGLGVAASFIVARLIGTSLRWKALELYGIPGGEQAYRGLAWMAALAAGVLLLARLRSIAAPMVIAGVSLLLTALIWDQRPPWTRAALEGPPPIEVSGPVIWTSHADMTWFVLRSTAWISNTQASGIVFSRPTTMEWLRRMQASRPAIAMRAWVPVPKIEPCGDVDPDLTAPQVAAVCHDNPGLFGIVTRRPVLAWPAQPFRTPARDIVVCQVRRKLYRVTRTSRFFLNACPVASQPTRLQTTKAATPERNF